MRRFWAWLLLLSAPVLALSGDEILKRVEARPAPETLHGKMVMELINKQGKRLTRELEIWTKREGDVEKMLIKFLAPPDVRGTAFLAIQKGDREEMKLYLPALKKVRRIAGGQRRGSFMGSDFSYDDISQLGNLRSEDYSSKLLREEEDRYVVEAKPKPEVRSNYERLVLWVKKPYFDVVKIEFYQKGALYKVMTLDEIQTFAGKYRIPTRLVMENKKTRHKTVLLQRELELDQPIPDSVFTERFMKR